MKGEQDKRCRKEKERVVREGPARDRERHIEIERDSSSVTKWKKARLL